MISVHANDFASWRRQARQLLSADVEPDEVHWLNEHESGLFGSPTLLTNQAETDLAKPRVDVPKQFIDMAKKAACFIDKTNSTHKWALLYSVLWRITHQHRNTLSLRSDPQVSAVYKMAKAVSRDIHKMHAFVRFQSNEDALYDGFTLSNGDSDQQYYTSWFEPDHAIVQTTAAFFVRRFTGMTWSILTPHGCSHWNQKTLRLSPGVSRPELQKDDFELFWKAYYCSIFNPARLKEKAMMNEMPKKYWKYLPEAQCIKDLTRDAASQIQLMANSDLTSPERVREQSSSVKQIQDGLRSVNRI